MGRRMLSFWELGRMKLIPSPLVPKCQGLNFLKNGGVGMACAGSRTCAKSRPKTTCPGAKKKWKKKQIKIDDVENLGHCMYMENEMTVLKINKFKSAVLVTVTYRLANGEVRVASGKTESEAMANMTTEATKALDFAPLPKRSNSGSYFRNNNGTMVEVWKKTEKKLDRKHQLD